MRHAIVILAALVSGCGQPADPKHPAPAPVGPTKTGGPAKPPPAGKANAGAGPSAPIVLPAIGCPTPSCVFHAGAAAYFTCLAGGAGACFHFGAACAPADACMYDPADRTYKHCARMTEGACEQWGAACAPASKCMFSAADGLHHTCDDVAGGGCKRYGALCAP